MSASQVRLRACGETTMKGKSGLSLTFGGVSGDCQTLSPRSPARVEEDQRPAFRSAALIVFGQEEQVVRADGLLDDSLEGLSFCTLSGLGAMPWARSQPRRR